MRYTLRTTFATLLSFHLLVAAATGAEDEKNGWSPAETPLMTPWGEQVDPENVWPEYPRPQLRRGDWVNLNGMWEYAITDIRADQPQTFDGEILVPFPLESALSGVGAQLGPDRWLWYRRTFEAPELEPGDRLMLHFGAVDWQAVVLVNGIRVGEHRGGYSPFSFDITSALTDADEQQLVVRVWDPSDAGSQPRGKQVRNPEGIWYTPVSGIWQTVWLEPLPHSSIDHLRITPDLNANAAQMDVLLRGPRRELSLRVTAKSEGETVFDQEVPATQQRIAIELDEPRLWSPDDPHLYDVTVALVAGDEVVDRVESYFGMRSIEMGKAEDGYMRMLLNGEDLFQFGLLDQGWWPDGLYTPPSDEAMRYDLEFTKEAGFNMLRKHVKIEPARLYYHADRLGLLIWQDMPNPMIAGYEGRHYVGPEDPEDADFTPQERAQFHEELQEMIDTLHHFPSIVAWVPFNEGWGQHETNTVLQWVMDYDPSRLVGGPSGWIDRGVGHMKDRHAYPGPDMFPAMEDRITVLGEFGGLGWPVENHLWEPDQSWGYRTYHSQEELREHYRTLIEQLPTLIGEGLAAAVYTQTTDVEIEVNGLLTYDRRKVKLPAKELAELHAPLYQPPPVTHTLLPAGDQQPQTWHYTMDEPADDWYQPDFDAGDWATGESGFGTEQTPNTTVRTHWDSSDIWIRRDFTLDQIPEDRDQIMLRMFHDENATVYINGVLAAQTPEEEWSTRYVLMPISDEARATLREGRNTIAIHCHDTWGGQYIDAGLVYLEPRERADRPRSRGAEPPPP